MTKLKCWKKYRTDKKLISYFKGKNTISIYPKMNTPNHYVRRYDGNITVNFFKTKPQALKFANKYMKKNDKC